MRQLDPDLLRLARNGQALAVFRWHDLNATLGRRSVAANKWSGK